jgi:hypothetical protein
VQNLLSVDLHAPENIVFMHKAIKEAFDRMELCLLVQPDLEYKVRWLYDLGVPPPLCAPSNP